MLFTGVQMGPPYVKWCACNMHVMYMHRAGDNMVHVTCVSLRRFTCMLHVTIMDLGHFTCMLH